MTFIASDLYRTSQCAQVTCGSLPPAPTAIPNLWGCLAKWRPLKHPKPRGSERLVEPLIEAEVGAGGVPSAPGC